MIRFNLGLTEPKKDTSPVRLVYYIDDRQHASYLGVSVETAHWDATRKMVRPGTPRYAELHAVLTSMSTLNAAIIQGTEVASIDNVKRYIRKATTNTKGKSLWEHLEEERQALPSDGSRKTYGFAIAKFKEHCGDRTPTAELFKVWGSLATRTSNTAPVVSNRRVKTWSMNGRYTYVAAVGSLLNKLHAKGTIAWAPPKIKKGQEHGGGVLNLTDAEIEAFAAFDLSHDEELGRVRDLFLLGMLSGARCSDWDFSLAGLGRPYVQKKTGKVAMMPKTPRMEAILKRHGGRLSAHGITYLRLRRLIKRIAKDVARHFAPLQSPVTYRGMEVQRWEALSSHSGRKSFVSRNINNPSIGIAGVMTFTGHRSVVQLDRYAKAQFSATDMMKHLAQ